MRWTVTKRLDTFAGPGEIKRREVSWTPTKKLDTFAGPGEIKRREVVLDPQVSPEESKRRELELGLKAGLLCLSYFSPAVLRTLSLCLCSAQQLRQQLHSTLVAAQWRGDTAVTFLLFWRQSTASLVFRDGDCDRVFTLSSPSLPVPVPNKQPRFCGH